MINFEDIEVLNIKSPNNAKRLQDIFYYSNLYNKAILNQGFPLPGVHEFLNEPEKMRSKKDWPPFMYVINEQGFRDVLPDPSTKNLLGFFGCSITFGEGMDTKDNFPYIVAKELNHTHINLGQPGSSAAKTALIFDAATNIWNISTAVITLPDWGRFLYMDKQGDLTNIIPAHPHDQGSESEEVRKCLLNEFSDNYLRYSFVQAVNYIVAVARQKNIRLILGSWHPESQEILRKVFCYHIAPVLENDYTKETARDNAHPHPKNCKLYADKLITLIKNDQYYC